MLIVERIAPRLDGKLHFREVVLYKVEAVGEGLTLDWGGKSAESAELHTAMFAGRCS